MTLLETFLPAYEFSERHFIVIQAPPGRVFAAIKAITPNEMPLFRALMLIRALPALMIHKRRPPFRGQRSIFEQAQRGGFTLLAERSDREMVLGIVGQFWKLSGNVVTVADGHEFLACDPPGYATAAINFHTAESGDGTTRLSTETRIHAGDAESRRMFARYWLVIRWGSGLIRRTWLRAIKHRAEAVQTERR